MNRGEVKNKRKTRSDKKKDVKPTISSELKNCIYRLSYITNIPVKDVTEMICMKGMQNKKVIEYLSQYFRRDFYFRKTLFIGSLENESLQNKFRSNKNERITTRFTQEFYEQVYQLSIALDVTPSKATAMLLDASVRNTNLVNAYVKNHLNQQIDKNRMKELRRVLKYINSNNPYNEELTWFSLASLIFDEIKDNTHSIKDKIYSWMDKK
ncbi:hypothetical protein [Virgibacillus halodenitrificans]|uniref:hypothetical protein n=1 Tax=Virgibacillus halodenitrificans TaxID=1482 RepID=UPI00045D3D5F|nr:hypothetical protein [Virgibacillus halodenitrificans]CDQ37684.1 hypothetical protein BN993_07246 [Virgibacillus halodenitrificans]